MRNKTDKLLIAVLCCFFVIIVLTAIQKRADGNTNIKYEVAQQENIFKTVNTQGVIIKSEEYLQFGGTGTIVPLVSDGEKIAGAQAYAKVFIGEAEADRYIAMLAIEDEIDYYLGMSNASGSGAANLDSINRQIHNDVYELLDTVYSNDLSKLQENTRSLRTSITMKQFMVGEEVNCDAKLLELQNRRDSMMFNLGQTLSTPGNTGGYYVANCDGYEYLDEHFDTCVGMNVEDIDKLLESEPQDASMGICGKLITDMACYFVCNVPTESLAEMKQYTYDVYAGKYYPATYEIVFPYSTAGTVTASVQSMVNAPDGRTAVVFKITTMNAGVANLRFETAQIRVKEYKNAFKIRKTAIRVTYEKDKDGNTKRIDWIWTATGSMEYPKQKRVQIEYYDGEYVVVTNPNNLRSYIRPYEKVIYEGTVDDVYDIFNTTAAEKPN